jgi:hypothetical protein
MASQRERKPSNKKRKLNTFSAIQGLLAKKRKGNP